MVQLRRRWNGHKTAKATRAGVVWGGTSAEGGQNQGWQKIARQYTGEGVQLLIFARCAKIANVYPC
jgi:hypothetical protein